MTNAVNAEKPLVALVGRPNVGKSTLFNRLVSGRVAIVESRPGVTRDRLYSPVQWLDRDFLLVDTGGITDERDSLARQVTDQALTAAAEADAILFVVDAKSGLLPADEVIAESLRRFGKPLLLVMNKAENDAAAAADFFALGFGPALAVSAEHGLGIGDLLEAVTAVLPPAPALAEEDVDTGVAVIGRPNVGKSTLVNALLGRDRVITADQPGTTRDAIDSPLVFADKKYTLIDTAGIRRAAKIDEPVEYYGVLRAIKAVERSDVVLLVLAAEDPATVQDQRVAGLAAQAGKACLILINKWDLKKQLPTDGKAVEDKVRTAFDFLSYAPIEFISARTGLGIDRIMPRVAEIAAEHARRVRTSQLNDVLNEAVLMHEPPSRGGRKLRLYYATQVKTKPPVIVIYVNDPGLVHFSYERYLQNRLREAFPFTGSPLVLRFKARTGRRDKNS